MICQGHKFFRVHGHCPRPTLEAALQINQLGKSWFLFGSLNFECRAGQNPLDAAELVRRIAVSNRAQPPIGSRSRFMVNSVALGHPSGHSRIVPMSQCPKKKSSRRKALATTVDQLGHQRLGHPRDTSVFSHSLGGDVIAKRLQMIKEVVPTLSRVALLVRESSPDTAQYVRESQTAARKLGVELQIEIERNPSDLEGIFVAV